MKAQSRKQPASQSFRLRYASPRQAAGTRKAESRKKKEKRKMRLAIWGLVDRMRGDTIEMRRDAMPCVFELVSWRVGEMKSSVFAELPFSLRSAGRRKGCEMNNAPYSYGKVFSLDKISARKNKQTSQSDGVYS